MKAARIMGILIFLLATLGSSSATASFPITNINLEKGSFPPGASVIIDVTYETNANKTITFVDQSTGVTNPRITCVAYNLSAVADHLTGFKDSMGVSTNWETKNSFGAEGLFGDFAQVYAVENPGSANQFTKVVVTLPGFNGNIPFNSKGNQVGVNFVCDEFSCFVAGSGNDVTTNENSALNLEKTAFPATYDTEGQTITYNYVVKNTGNVPISGLTVTDDKLGVSSRSNTILEPNNSTTVMTTYMITQADLNAGSVTNVADAVGTYNGNEINSNTCAVTVTADKSALNFDKTEPQSTYSATYDNMQVVSNMTIVTLASPTNYSTEGQTITYNYIVTNTGNVDIKGPITITDNKTNPIVIYIDLAPGLNTTGNAIYNITRADLDAGYVSNLASATGTYTMWKSNRTTIL